MKKNRMDRRIYKALLALMMGVFVMTFTGCEIPAQEDAGSSLEVSDDLVMHFLDVGQADCTLLVSKGEAMLIDAGNRDDSALVMGYLQHIGVDRLKYMVLTHTDEDHIGSAEAVLESMPVDRVFVQRAHLTVTGEYLMKELDRKDMEAEDPQPGQTLTFGDCKIEFVGPVRRYDSNDDNSICLRVSHGSIDTLFTGDAGIRQEEDMIKDGQPLEAEILQSGHHGSSKSNGYKLLDAADPEYTVISCEAGNDYGHPHRETLKRLESKGVQVYRTDTQGTIVARSDGSSLQFETVSKDSMEALESEYEQQPFIANMNSGTYHSPTCEGLPKKENRIYFRTAKDARAAGYEPCGVCEP